VELLKEAEKDNEVKCILLHGGKFFSSGSDISGFRNISDPEEFHRLQKYAIGTCMVDMLLALNACNKPIVAMVRGGSIGIGYTLLSHVTLIYCSPDATFKTPFMESGQTPEGTSTLLFPLLYGPKKGNEVILLDPTLTA